MPVYHLHLFNDNDVLDEEGQEFVDLAMAEREAVRNARDVIAEHVRHGHPINLTHRVEITDANGTLLKVVHFGDCIHFAR
ncbi:DUF6894 family protein [Sphingobium lactosutens]|uniref:DUF6894 domain-containing protein n=1 Tax=Sphingobium lactosutens DS20 TaxID=1331060 RepID=T0HKL1_9SPHN|nr:hypothetical protein RLDS_18265 [Sphingobium lactosutens DS20]